MYANTSSPGPSGPFFVCTCLTLDKISWNFCKILWGVGELPERGVFEVTVNFVSSLEFGAFDKNGDYRRGIVFIYTRHYALYTAWWGVGGVRWGQMSPITVPEYLGFYRFVQ